MCNKCVFTVGNILLGFLYNINPPSILSLVLTPDLSIKSSFCSCKCLRAADLNPTALCTLFPLDICPSCAYSSEHNTYCVVCVAVQDRG